MLYESWRGRMWTLFGGEKFSTSALLKNFVALNSLKLTVKKLRVESGAARIQPWSFRKLFETSEVSEFAEVRTTASSVSQTYEDTWGILGLLREWLYTWEDAKLLDVPALNNFHKVDTLFWKFRYTVNRIFWLFSRRYCRQGLNQIIPEIDKYLKKNDIKYLIK